jgi:hypothetical protein
VLSARRPFGPWMHASVTSSLSGPTVDIPEGSYFLCGFLCLVPVSLENQPAWVRRLDQPART